jgi:hypothetical protein
MGLWSKRERVPVATVEVGLYENDLGRVTAWVEGAERETESYHAILHFLMYYARILFFLSFRDTAEELLNWMDDAVRALAATQGDAPLTVGREWRLSEAPPGEPLAVWASSLVTLGPGSYKCVEQRPADPEDRHAQAVALLFLQHLVNGFPAYERAFLALSISGMHEYYRDVQHWNSTKSLHPAPAHGISRARRVLRGS